MTKITITLDVPDSHPWVDPETRPESLEVRWHPHVPNIDPAGRLRPEDLIVLARASGGASYRGVVDE